LLVLLDLCERALDPFSFKSEQIVLGTGSVHLPVSVDLAAKDNGEVDEAGDRYAKEGF